MADLAGSNQRVKGTYKMAKRDLTSERLRELMCYGPETGVFVWRIPRKKIRVGAVAGGVMNNGYVSIHVEGKSYLAHRLAWLYVYGEWPKGLIDHINMCRTDNRISNLRDVTKRENCIHTKTTPRTGANQSGFRGVYPHRSRFQAKIKTHGRSVYLGDFDSPEEAHNAYLSARARLHVIKGHSNAENQP